MSLDKQDSHPAIEIEEESKIQPPLTDAPETVDLDDTRRERVHKLLGKLDST